MLMVGERRVLLSHLPMFHAPHDWQIILEVGLSAPTFDPRKRYVDDRGATRGKVYTWVPKPFVLSDILASRPVPPSMVGTIFRGHFERGGVAITADDVEARVERILYARRLVPSDPAPAEGRYLLFGGRSEPFLAHEIIRPPDFDQVTSVEVVAASSDWLSAWDGAGTAVKVDTDRPGDAALVEDERISVTRLDGPASGSAVLQVRQELYLERGDLAS